MKQGSPIAVLGAGSWGTALALLLARNGQSVVLWGRDAAFMAQLASARTNARFLPGLHFPAALQISSDLQHVFAPSPDILLAVPSHGFRETLQIIKPHINSSACVAWATKGFDPGSGRLLHRIAAELLGDNQPVAVISGPTFAREVASGAPTAVTVGSQFPGCAKALAARLHNDSFRAYTSDDITGVEVGGAVKNVLAIAAGIADGLGLGANTRAALITRGLAEMMRLGVALGGQRETMMGLAGLGDLVLTCTDDQSR
ncbi:MAG: NAD(P)H-dependent glycerol-3-phosphate dehydrogenase, partial [Gammaproteobacteria bacterium]